MSQLGLAEWGRPALGTCHPTGTTRQLTPPAAWWASSACCRGSSNQWHPAGAMLQEGQVGKPSTVSAKCHKSGCSACRKLAAAGAGLYSQGS